MLPINRVDIDDDQGLIDYSASLWYLCAFLLRLWARGGAAGSLGTAKHRHRNCRRSRSRPFTLILCRSRFMILSRTALKPLCSFLLAFARLTSRLLLLLFFTTASGLIGVGSLATSFVSRSIRTTDSDEMIYIFFPQELLKDWACWRRTYRISSA